MLVVAWILILTAAGAVVYTYLLYPLILWSWGSLRRRGVPVGDPESWPPISITVPAYNEASQIRDTVESLLRIEYPADKRQILIVSDASTDGTDEIVREYASLGVELLRMPERVGKTAAENAARPHLTGEIVINTDASIRIDPPAVKALVREFSDPRVGVASGCDISTGRVNDRANTTESGYVGYEMWVRSLETRVGGIVGASGCFYAIRAELHGKPLPPGLSRDFASAMIAHEHGFRAVSVNQAVCLVPRTSSLHAEFRRKVRTMVRGMQTLFFKRRLLDPLSHGRFAFMLFSHKVCRWLVPLTLGLGLLGLAVLSFRSVTAGLLVASALGVLLLAGIGWRWPEHRPMPAVLAVPAFAVAANVAALVALVRSARGRADQLWEPTRRDAATAPPPTAPGLKER